jgi:hypothetical protein
MEKHFTPPFWGDVNYYMQAVRPRSERSWGRYVKKLYSNKCLITGADGGERELEKHHVISRSVRPDLKLHPLNGVLLCAEIHKDLHAREGYKVGVPNLLRYLDMLEKTQLVVLRPRFAEVRRWLIRLDSILLTEDTSPFE